MTAIVPPPNVLAAQQTFRTLLDAMTRPGTIHELLQAGNDVPELTVCLTLLDYEVSYAVANAGTHTDAAIAELEARIGLETGCRRVALSDAAFVLTYGPLPKAAWSELRRGTLAFPDQGTTIIYMLPAVGEQTADGIATTVTLTGPGIESEQSLTVSGLAATEFTRLASVNRDYPMGVDAILLDPRGRVACIPRSSAIAVKEA